MYIKPASNYWSFRLDRSTVKPDQDNVVTLKPLSEQFSGFPKQEIYGWGHQAMHLDSAKIKYRGKGIKIAIIDSGFYNEHDDLGEGKAGHDFTKGSTGWTKDTVGHGTHVAGVIVGLHEATGIKGFAPEADVFVYKVFPGGRTADPIEALNRCIENQVDVVNLSLGMEKKSEALERKIRQATDKGVACIATAGNSATSIQYPAAFPDVLSVAAIGQQGIFPKDSEHSQQVGHHAIALG